MTEDALSAVERERLLPLLRDVLGSSGQDLACEVLKRAEDYLVVRVGASRNLPALVAKLAGPRANIACPFEATAALNRLIRKVAASRRMRCSPRARPTTCAI